MKARPTLLDLFCGAGGAFWGYMQAGFYVTGIDIQPQKHYPGHVFVQRDALEYVSQHGHKYDVIHASPPCQAYSVLKHFSKREHPALVSETRHVIHGIGKPFVIENVVGAPLHFPLMLCGSMFSLKTPCGAQLRRHRLFESSHLIFAPGECNHGQHTIVVAGHDYHNSALRYHRRKARAITVTGSTPQQNVERNHIREVFSVADARIAMEIDWMNMAELSQAIPPAYTHWIGQQITKGGFFA